MILNTIKNMGPMRQMLVVLALLLTAMMPWADVSLPPRGWGLFWGSVLPAAVPIVFMVVMLDLLMCRVLRADADASIDRRRDLNVFSVIYLLVSVLMVAAWLPVFLKAAYL